MGVAISSTLLDRLLNEAAAAADYEVCGLLFGTAARIEAARQCANVAADPATRFEIDPAALLAAHRQARSGGARVVGCYHSHPSGAAVPSICDAQSAMGDGALWLIIAGRDGRLWQSLDIGVFVEIPLEPVSPS